jgi:hypothetical protein
MASSIPLPSGGGTQPFTRDISASSVRWKSVGVRITWMIMTPSLLRSGSGLARTEGIPAPVDGHAVDPRSRPDPASAAPTGPPIPSAFGILPIRLSGRA